MMATKAKGGVVMLFRFSGMGKAYGFQDELKRLGYEASATFTDGAWTVKTDSRCLADAAALVKNLH